MVSSARATSVGGSVSKPSSSKGSSSIGGWLFGRSVGRSLGGFLRLAMVGRQNSTRLVGRPAERGGEVCRWIGLVSMQRALHTSCDHKASAGANLAQALRRIGASHLREGRLHNVETHAARGA